MMDEGIYSNSNRADVLTMQNLDDTARSFSQAQNLAGKDGLDKSPTARGENGQSFPKLSNQSSGISPFESHAEPSDDNKPFINNEDSEMMMATKGENLREES